MPDHAADTRFAIAAVLTFYDAAITWIALDMLGGTEINPLLSGLMDSIGTGPALLARVAVGLLLVWSLYRLRRRRDNRFGARPLSWAVWALVGVAVWNTGMVAAWMAGATG